MEFIKTLSPSEAKYKYLGLNKKIREEFPEKDKIFKLKFKNKIFDMKVNNKDSIMLTQLYHVYQFAEGDEIKITKNKNGVFEFTVNDQKNM
jgi:hypothetical protein